MLKSCTAIGTRKEPLSEDEGLRLGLATTVKLVKAREMIRDHWKSEAERKAEDSRRPRKRGRVKKGRRRTSETVSFVEHCGI